jgi:hypothetical protein
MANGLFNLKQVMQAVQQGGWPAQRTPSVEYLVVAGGGGGGKFNGGGGGGAGGVLVGIDPVPNGQTLLVTVGGGGAGSSTTFGANGSNSVFGAISSVGGGGGGAADGASSTENPGRSGGSGGGSGTNGSGFVSSGQGTFGQGNAGGRGNSDATTWRHGGGGGGAGTVGFDVISGTSGGYGNGGAGISSVINGTVTAYAGGGGGGIYQGVSSIGGVGGGGAGGNNAGSSSTAGTANTGGGGGGGGGATGAAGGSGIVIVSYPDVYAAATSSTGSPTVSTSGSGSLSFNGTSQYLTYANNAANNLGTGSFTIEAFVYISNFANNRYIGVQANPSTLAAGWALAVRAASNIVFYMNGSIVLTSSTLSTNTWYHVAVVRNGTAIAMYVDGTLVASGTSSANIDYGGDLGVGAESSSGNYFSGNMSNFRIVKGTAVYTAAFTPLTAPLTPVSGTGLLLNTVSGAYLVDSSSNAFRPTVYNSVAWNQLSPFATGSGYKNRVYTWTSSGSITF